MTQLCLSAAMQSDVSLRSVRLQVHLPTSLSDTPLTSQTLYATRGVLKPELNSTLPLSPPQLTRLGALLHKTNPSAVTTVLPRTARNAGLSQPWSAFANEEEEEGESASAGARASGSTSRFNLSRLGRRAKPTATTAKGAAVPAPASENVSGNAAPDPLMSTSAALEVGSLLLSSGAAQQSGGLSERGASGAGYRGMGSSAARIEFVLVGDGWNGESTLGVGVVDLRQMLLSGEDKLLVGVELKDAFGQQSALVHASVVALQALRLAWWSHARHEHIGARHQTEQFDLPSSCVHPSRTRRHADTCLPSRADGRPRRPHCKAYPSRHTGGFSGWSP